MQLVIMTKERREATNNGYTQPPTHMPKLRLRIP